MTRLGSMMSHRRGDRLEATTALEGQSEAALLALMQICCQTLEGFAARGFAIWLLGAAIVAATVGGYYAIPITDRHPDLLLPIGPILASVLVATWYAYQLVVPPDDNPVSKLSHEAGAKPVALRDVVNELSASIDRGQLYVKVCVDSLATGAWFTGFGLAIFQWSPQAWNAFGLQVRPDSLSLDVLAVGGTVAVVARGADLAGRRWRSAVSMVSTAVGPGWLLLLSILFWIEVGAAAAVILGAVMGKQVSHEVSTAAVSAAELLGVPIAILYNWYNRRRWLLWTSAIVPFAAPIVVVLLFLGVRFLIRHV